MRTNTLLNKHMACNHDLSINQMYVLLHTIASNSASAIFVLNVQVGNSCYSLSTYSKASATDHEIQIGNIHRLLRTLCKYLIKTQG